jgi:hypothetical protein
MILTTPLRRTTLHLRQIFLTEAITFIPISVFRLAYLALNVIRPLVRSYGVIWTVTLSPGRMRM